jgi:hypothetical protein
MDPAVECVRHLGVDLGTKPGQTAKGRLDVPAGAAKPVIEVKMPKGGVDVVKPHQANHPPAKPDAFRIAGRPTDGLRRFGEFVGLALIFLGCVSWLSRIGRRRFAGLLLGPTVAALGGGASNTDQQYKPGDGEVAQNRILELKQPSTHKFPDKVPDHAQLGHAGLMPFKWVPNAAETLGGIP